MTDAPTEADRRRSHRGRSLRLRVTAAATAVVLVILTVGAVLFVVALDAQLVDAEAAVAREQAESLADRLDDGDAQVGATLAADDDLVAQVQRGDDVVAQTEEASELGVLPDDDGARVVLDDEPHVVAVEEFDDGRVVVARSLDGVQEATAAVTWLLAVAVPLVTALIAVVVAAVVGRALRPVERMRREVASIRPDDLAARVAPPAGAAELGALADTMNALLDRVDGALREQRRFVGDASHELRSPIASLRQHAELARDYPGATDLAHLAEVVDAESGRLADLVDALLVLARSGERTALRLESLDLADLVVEEADRLRALGGPRVEVSAEPARIRGDADLLRRALRNLGDNARRHASTAVTLEVTAGSGEAVLHVDDDGDGIAEADRERVFGRFVRLDEARSRDAGGAGLGLAIVAEAAAHHGGAVSVGTAPGGGARFELRLPLA
ncbi:cell wall metabolism sensor histidine kinase WalK [Agromyces sp. LHK192]|uniref:sensor histidine kinase n=1 Tax=Agromyces sp. LHK192 TaxID=2498704 RepID=UPI000FD9B4C6|nr:ATP-binding protein [Agromyces sp. LHK192]